MTPSQAHDGAYQRDAGHDAMQVAVFRHLHGAADPNFYSSEERFYRRLIQAEMPLILNERIIGWADIAECYVGEKSRKKFWRIFELKPKVTSTGGLVRQIRTLRHIAPRALMEWGDTSPVTCYVEAVVPFDDPAIIDLNLLGVPPLIWDMQEGRFADEPIPGYEA